MEENDFSPFLNTEKNKEKEGIEDEEEGERKVNKKEEVCLTTRVWYKSERRKSCDILGCYIFSQK